MQYLRSFKGNLKFSTQWRIPLIMSSKSFKHKVCNRKKMIKYTEEMMISKMKTKMVRPWLVSSPPYLPWDKQSVSMMMKASLLIVKLCTLTMVRGYLPWRSYRARSQSWLRIQFKTSWVLTESNIKLIRARV